MTVTHDMEDKHDCAYWRKMPHGRRMDGRLSVWHYLHDEKRKTSAAMPYVSPKCGVDMG